MKMTKLHFAQLEQLLAPVFTRHADKIPTLRNTHADRRIAWDILWASDKNQRENWLNAAWDYLNDSHIETGLMKVFRKHYTK